MKRNFLYVLGIVGWDLYNNRVHAQTQHDYPAPSTMTQPNVDSLSDQDVRQRILTDAWRAAEAAKSHVEELTQQIQTLKRRPGSDPKQIQELEQQRLLLLRQHMVSQQFRTIPDTLKTTDL